MTISGLTIIRNGVRGAYPFMESILTVLPYVDEYVVMYESNDGTFEVLEKMARVHPKIRLFEEKWDLSQGSSVIASVTNKGLERCTGDWVIHNQADEVYTSWALTIAVDRIKNDEPFNGYLVKRVQTGLNFQDYYMGESGAWVARIGRRGKISSIGDGLTMHIEGEKWDFLEADPLNFHLYDVTRTFIGNFPGRSECQADIWWMNANRNSGGWFGKTPEEWAAKVEEMKENGFPEECLLETSPYGDRLPELMKFWIGKPLYYPRLELLSESNTSSFSDPVFYTEDEMNWELNNPNR